MQAGCITYTPMLTAYAHAGALYTLVPAHAYAGAGVREGVLVHFNI